tara:strand:- start:112013 stop:112156 length:144 start_codon:yes stop_codon:yes gene_type:complete
MDLMTIMATEKMHCYKKEHAISETKYEPEEGLAFGGIMAFFFEKNWL